MEKYCPPEVEKEAFHCPYCQVYSAQSWSPVYDILSGSYETLMGYNVGLCCHCEKFTFWNGEKMIVPKNSSAPPPHPDMPPSIIDDYKEARAIVNDSPRGSAALLRLALQKLMKELGESGENINKDIGSLVKKGLSPMVQQSLDILRVIGNESVHPGELNMKDDITTANKLFEIINFIIEDRITREKEISELYQSLPESKRQGIENRDS